MRFLTVTGRELRTAARQKATHRIRWVTAAAFFGLLLWLMWVFDGFQARGAGPRVFQAFAIVTYLYCALIGATRTADCISSEKREGTLGLLFLTNLNSAEIVAGKLCSSALAAVYGLFAIFPLLALLMLMGGVTFSHFWLTVLALANAIFFSMAAGFLASVLSVRQFPAIALAMGLAIVFGPGAIGAAEALRAFGGTDSWAEAIAVWSPLYAVNAADGTRRVFGQNRYWLSMAAVAGLSWAWLALATWRLAFVWRDRAAGRRRPFRFGLPQRRIERAAASRARLRRRLMDINPFFWLGGRQRVSAPIFLLLSAGLILLTVQVSAPYFGRVMRGSVSSPLLGHLFAWLWTGMAIHLLTHYYAAAAAAQRLAEDKQTGALEVVLSTPVTERSISRGLWLAYGRRMLAPLLVAALVHFFFIWHGATLFVIEAPSELPAGITPGRLIVAALFDRPIGDFRLDWHFGFILRILLLALVVVVANWVTLGWLGRWLGLRMKHPGLAPLTAVTLVLVPPWLLYGFVCWLFDEWDLDRMPERRFLPMMMWIGFGMGIGHCLLLSLWAAGRLRRDLRRIVTSRFQPRERWRWRRPTRRTFLRFAGGTAVLAALVLGFNGYQNWSSRRNWTMFQMELSRRGESLDLAALLPEPVAGDQNFARTPGFQRLLARNSTNDPAARRLFDRLIRIDSQSSFGARSTLSWQKQQVTDHMELVGWINPKADLTTELNSRQGASDLVEALQPLAETMRAVEGAAQRPFFQYSTNRDTAAVFHLNRPALTALERLHFLFQIRAGALLSLDRPAEGGEDVLTSLRLAGLARQSPDLRASTRVNFMLARSLQPLWEGMLIRRWTGSQLAAFQRQLRGFDLLSDHTNALRRVVLAYIDVWRQNPDSNRPGSARRKSQPRAWWFDNCIQIYRAGRNAIGRVDIAGGRVDPGYDWSDLNVLQIDGEATRLFRQVYWQGIDPGLVAYAQTAVNQAILACALERYALARGAYPESLDSLVPEYIEDIPRDIVRGSPMLYQRTDDGRYILRGVGPNRTNDSSSKTGSDDWLWSYPVPTNSPPGAATSAPSR